MNVTGKPQKVFVIFNEEGFEATLEEMTASFVSHIEIARIGYSKPLHAFGEIRSVCPNQEMVVIVHQHIGENVNVKPLMHSPQYIQE